MQYKLKIITDGIRLIKQTWLRHGDQFESAKVLLGELDGDYRYRTFHVRGFHALNFFIDTSISFLYEAKEITVDATHGTNSVGIELRALLAELDSVGIPLGCLLIHKSISPIVRSSKLGLE